MTIARIDIAHFIETPNAITHSYGVKVYEEAMKHLNRGEKVLLDFSNLKNLTTGFLQACLGRIIHENIRVYNTQIKIDGLSSVWKDKFEQVFLIASRPTVNDSWNNILDNIINKGESASQDDN